MWKKSQLYALDVFRPDVVLFGVAGEHQGQGSVTGDVTGGAEAVLEGEDRQHEGQTLVTKEKNPGDEAQRGHHRPSRHTGGADGEDPQQEAEQHHGTHAGKGPVEDLRDRHHKEHFGKDRAAQVDVGKERDAEVHHVTAEVFALVGAVQGHRQSGRRGHGAHGGEVGGAVVAQHLQPGTAGVDAGGAIENGQP